MKSFVIIFRQGPYSFTEADLLRRQQKVSAWAREQNAAGHELEPRILSSDVLRPNGDGGLGEESWPLTALLFLQAADLAEAGRIAAAHPAKEFNASVEVRPWAPPTPGASPAR